MTYSNSEIFEILTRAKCGPLILEFADDAAADTIYSSVEEFVRKNELPFAIMLDQNRVQILRL